MVVVVVGVVGMVVVVVMIVVGAMVVPGLINATGYDDTVKCRQVEQCHAPGPYSCCLLAESSSATHRTTTQTAQHDVWVER